MPKFGTERSEIVKKKNKIAIRVIIGLLLIGMIIPIGKTQYQAATSYTNAKEFYESTGLKGEQYHADISNGMFYLATRGKLASSSSNLKYYTVGYDITLSGNGYEVTFSVKRGDSMKQVSDVTSSNYNYVLYCIDTETLYSLAQKVNTSVAQKVMEASTIQVIANAVMTTKKGTTVHGSVLENGSGGLTESGTIYHLKNDSNWNEMKKIFSGHEFKSYRKIKGNLENYQLSIRYNVKGTDSANAGCTSTAEVGNGYSVSNNYLAKSGKTVIEQTRVVNTLELLSKDTINLKKTGYHLETNREWITSDNRVFSSQSTYMPKDIASEVGYKDKGITMYANWLPNHYTISYHANGGAGTLPASNFIYDTDGTLRNNTFSREGYHLKVGAEWNTKADGTGTSYSSGQAVKNLTAEDGKKITLYANWEADVYEITTDKQGGTGGTEHFYEKYEIAWYKENSLQNVINMITVPNKTGYSFLGYYENVYGLGTSVINADGNINIGTDYFKANAVVYASYKAKQYQVTFDKQGGTGGTDSVTATYGKLLPEAVAPLRSGFTFLGYYRDEACENDLYYSKHMACEKEYLIDEDSTLYAKWTDDIPPVVTIASETEHWTNRAEGIEITVFATDLGIGKLPYLW